MGERRLTGRAPVGAIALALVFGCAEDRLPDVVLISLDTLRLDAVGAPAPHGGSFTPHLDALSRRSVRFTQAFAPAPFTLSSHMTLFTGLAPDVHGVETERDRLAADVSTLTEHLSRAGYATIGIATNAWMKAEYGFDRGFDHYEVLEPGPAFAERARRRAFELVDESEGRGRPLFLFLHLLDAHSDWEALPYDSPDAYHEDLAVRERDFCSADGVCATRFLMAADRSGEPVPKEVAELVRALYLRGVAHLDAELGELFEGLDRRGRLEPALVVVTSDHGEEFHEHGRFLHAQPFVESLAVPLVLKFPGAEVEPRAGDALASTEDVLPTVLDYLGLDPSPQAQGVSLWPIIANERGATRRDAVFGKDRTVQRRRTVRDVRFRLVLRPGDGAVALYDTHEDPAEQVDVAHLHPGRVQSLRERLEARLRSDGELARRLDPERDGSGANRRSPLDEGEAAWLRALGYLD